MKFKNSQGIFKNSDINKFDYLHLGNLINKLIDNYDLQKEYDETIVEIREKLNFDNSEIEDAKKELLSLGD